MTSHFGKVIVEMNGSDYRINEATEVNRDWIKVTAYQYGYELEPQVLEVKPGKFDRVEGVPLRLQRVASYLRDLSSIMLKPVEVQGKLAAFEREFGVTLTPRPANPSSR